jgi:hypothetical protein
MTWLRPENASNVVFLGRGHLVSAFLGSLRFFCADRVAFKLCHEVPGRLGEYEIYWRGGESI